MNENWRTQAAIASVAPVDARDASASCARRPAAKQVRKCSEHPLGVQVKMQDVPEEDDRQFNDRSKDPMTPRASNAAEWKTRANA